MTENISLSIWLDQAGRRNRLRQFEKLLRTFPFSQRPEQPQSTVSVLAVQDTEPPLLERAVNGPLDVDEALASLRDYSGTDVAYVIEGWWDLWALTDEDWGLRPVAVVLSCFGPEFDNGASEDLNDQEDIRIDLGVDAYFLPTTDPRSIRMAESNIRSALRLVSELDKTLNIARRQLQTETGENFAERIEASLRVLKNQ